MDVVTPMVKSWSDLFKDFLKERTAVFHEELIPKVWSPSRVEKLLEMGVDLENL